MTQSKNEGRQSGGVNEKNEGERGQVPRENRRSGTEWKGVSECDGVCVCKCKGDLCAIVVDVSRCAAAVQCAV